jgi:hypothetical protein
MSVHKSVGNENLAHLFPEAQREIQTKRSPQGSKASNQPVQDTNLVDALDALPSVLKVPSLDTWKAVLREGPDWTDETLKSSPHLSARGTHPRGSSTQERDRGRREEIESRTTGLVQEKREPGEVGRSCNPHDQSLSPSPLILGSQGADMQPKQRNNFLP